MSAPLDPGHDLGRAVPWVHDAPAGTLTSPLPVLTAATEAVTECLTAAAELAELRHGRRPAVQVGTAEVAAAVTSERRVRRSGVLVGGGFAPLSRFWPAADGWLRTHANYAWHRAALLAALGLADEVDEAAVGAAISRLPAEAAQERIVAAGGVAAAVRDAATWAAGPVFQANALRPLIDHEIVGDAVPRAWPGGGVGSLPCSGLRVLDLTRVIAGPVATRMLAALGADVLRVDPPDLPELPLHVADGLLGKRSALLSARDPVGRARLHELAHGADVIVCGYRPGALDLLRLSPAAIAYDHPGAVLVTLSAWGTTGPWQRRRGFDSLVQAASAIAIRCSPDGATPGVLPCQLLDHAAGYLAAAAALQALARQRHDGGTRGAWISLARVAQWLQELDPARRSPLERAPSAGEPVTPDGPALQDLDGLEVVPPPGSLDGVALRWPGGRPAYGASLPRW